MALHEFAMDRRQFLTSTALAALAVRPIAALAAGNGGDGALYAAMDRAVDKLLVQQPEAATSYGLDKGAHAALKSRLSDRSTSGFEQRLALHREILASLRAIDPAGLSDTARLRQAIAIDGEEQAVASARFGIESAEMPYPVTQLSGAYFEIPDFLDSQHAIDGKEDAEAYLERLALFAPSLDAEAARQRELATRGLVAPAWSLELALGQIAQLRTPAPEASTLALSLGRRATAKGLAGDWAGRVGKIVADQVYPALDRHAAMLRALQEHTPAGDGIWRVAQGEEIYATALQAATTTRLSPEEVHKIGLDHVADFTAKLDALLRQHGLTTGSVGERLTHLNTAPDQLYPDNDAGRAALIADLNTGIAEVRQQLPRFFTDAPNDPLEIRRVPPQIQDGAPNGYYSPGALDGSRQAIYWINLKSTGDWPRYQLPDLTYHEGIPGHHLQLSYVRHAGELPLLLRMGGNSAYIEGWALYSEQLADELGIMPGLVRAGYYQSMLFRSARLVVDTGLHYKRWSRAQATAYMVNATGMTRPRTQREVDRYCAMIGQACSYKIGHDTWARLRAKAQTALGGKFSLPWFHDVLKDGVMPLSLLEQRVDERIAAARTGH